MQPEVKVVKTRNKKAVEKVQITLSHADALILTSLLGHQNDVLYDLYVVLEDKLPGADGWDNRLQSLVEPVSKGHIYSKMWRQSKNASVTLDSLTRLA